MTIHVTMHVKAIIRKKKCLTLCILNSSTNPSIHPPIHAYSSTHSFIHPLIHPPIHPPRHPFIHPPIHPSIHSFIHWFIHGTFSGDLHGTLNIHPPIHSSSHPPIHPFIKSFIHPLIHPPIHPSTHSLIHPSIHSFIQSSTHPSIHPSIHSFTHCAIPAHYVFFWGPATHRRALSQSAPWTRGLGILRKNVSTGDRQFQDWKSFAKLRFGGLFYHCLLHCQCSWVENSCHTPTKKKTMIELNLFGQCFGLLFMFDWHKKWLYMLNGQVRGSGFVVRQSAGDLT